MPAHRIFRTARRTGLLLTGLGIALLMGCLNLEPRSDPTRYYVLSGREAAPEGFSEERYRDSDAALPLLEMRLLVFPDYARRPGLAVREGPHEIRYLPWHRWAENPEDTFQTALREALSERLPSWLIAQRPQSGSARVDVEVLEINAYASGTAVLRARWRFRPASTGTAGDSAGGAYGPFREGAWQQPWDPARPASLVAAHSANVRSLARALADSIPDP